MLLLFPFTLEGRWSFVILAYNLYYCVTFKAFSSVPLSSVYRPLSHDVTAAMLVFQTNPVGVELFSYINTFFCSNKFAQTPVT